jgi:site-specific DNA-adenine methylase
MIEVCGNCLRRLDDCAENPCEAPCGSVEISLEDYQEIHPDTPIPEEDEIIPTNLKAPFPYFGGKRNIANLVWQAIGDVKHYVEPFCGSCAVLLMRPDYDPTRHVETVNDADGHIANVWRCLKECPEETAEWADWPVNHAELSARRKYLLEYGPSLLQNLAMDVNYRDPQMAGYYIWCQGCWIGSGLLTPPKGKKESIGKRPHLGNTGTGVHKISIGQRPHLGDTGTGVHKISLGQMPHLGDTGKGVHKISLGKIPHLGDTGKGVHKISIGKIPHLGDTGKGVHKISIGKIPHLGNTGKGVHKISLGQIPHLSTAGSGVHKISLGASEGVLEWFRQLSSRLRRVRVTCGDWTVTCNGHWQGLHGQTVGFFLDPPYGHKANREKDLYNEDSMSLTEDVIAWALERAQDNKTKIVLCGYIEEGEPLLNSGWSVHTWKANGGYGNQGGPNENRHREALFLSPQCLPIQSK